MKHARKLAATSKKRKRQRYLEVAHDRGKEELLAIYREDDQATYNRIKEEALTVYPNGQGRKERHPLTDFEEEVLATYLDEQAWDGAFAGEQRLRSRSGSDTLW